MGNTTTSVSKKGSGDSAESSSRNGAPQIGMCALKLMQRTGFQFLIFTVKEFLEKAKEEFEEKWKKNPTVRFSFYKINGDITCHFFSEHCSFR
jgi:hypothetical protein